jgi:hypothetical protein
VPSSGTTRLAPKTGRWDDADDCVGWVSSSSGRRRRSVISDVRSLAQWREPRGTSAAVGSWAVCVLNDVDVLAQQFLSLRCLRGEIGNVPEALVVPLARVFGLDAVVPQVGNERRDEDVNGDSAADVPFHRLTALKGLPCRPGVPGRQGEEYLPMLVVALTVRDVGVVAVQSNRAGGAFFHWHRTIVTAHLVGAQHDHGKTRIHDRIVPSIRRARSVVPVQPLERTLQEISRYVRGTPSRDGALSALRNGPRERPLLPLVECCSQSTSSQFRITTRRGSSGRGDHLERDPAGYLVVAGTKGLGCASRSPNVLYQRGSGSPGLIIRGREGCPL